MGAWPHLAAGWLLYGWVISSCMRMIRKLRRTLHSKLSSLPSKRSVIWTIGTRKSRVSIMLTSSRSVLTICPLEQQSEFALWSTGHVEVERAKLEARRVSLYPSGCDCACTFVIHDNNAARGDDAVCHFEGGRDRATGKQPLSSA
jgi:hypothetical protein